MTPILEVQAIQAGYGAGLVLHGIDLAAQQAEAVGLMGRNGMGKTTLIRAIMGLLPLRAGQVRVDGRDLAGLRRFGALNSASPSSRKAAASSPA